MARPSLKAGELGKISTRMRTSDTWNARANCRLLDGTLRSLSASAPSEDEAIDAIRRLAARLTSGIDVRLHSDSTIADAVTVWLEHAATRVTPASFARYKSDANFVVKRIGAVPLSRVNTPFIEEQIHRVHVETTRARAAMFRKILSQVLSVAARRDAISTNPVREASAVPGQRKRESALTPDGWKRVLLALETWAGGTSAFRTDWERLRDALVLCIGLGARIGEALAIRRCDVSLTDGTVRLCGTIVDPRNGSPVHRQDHTKSRNDRVIPLTPAVGRVLVARLTNAGEAADSLLFETRLGTPVPVGLVEKAMRKFRAATTDLWDELGIPLNEVTTHLMRRSAATHVERRGGLSLASHLLGHSSENITRTVYVTTARSVDSQAADILADFDVAE